MPFETGNGTGIAGNPMVLIFNAKGPLQGMHPRDSPNGSRQGITPMNPPRVPPPGWYGGSSGGRGCILIKNEGYGKVSPGHAVGGRVMCSMLVATRYLNCPYSRKKASGSASQSSGRSFASMARSGSGWYTPPGAKKSRGPFIRAPAEINVRHFIVCKHIELECCFQRRSVSVIRGHRAEGAEAHCVAVVQR